MYQQVEPTEIYVKKQLTNLAVNKQPYNYTFVSVSTKYFFASDLS